MRRLYNPPRGMCACWVLWSLILHISVASPRPSTVLKHEVLYISQMVNLYNLDRTERENVP